MVFTIERVNAGVDARFSDVLFLSAHSEFSADGLSEVAGLSRVAVAMAAAVDRVAVNSSAVSISVPAGGAVKFLGLFDALSEGTFLGMFPLGSTKSLPGVAVAEAGAVASTFWVANHGFAAGQSVVFFAVDGVLPGGVEEGDVYRVVGSPTLNSFQVSTTAGGAVVNVAGSGSFIVSDIVPEVFGSAGTLEVAAGAFSFVGLA